MSYPSGAAAVEPEGRLLKVAVGVFEAQPIPGECRGIPTFEQRER